MLGGGNAIDTPDHMSFLRVEQLDIEVGPARGVRYNVAADGTCIGDGESIEKRFPFIDDGLVKLHRESRLCRHRSGKAPSENECNGSPDRHRGKF